MEDGEQAPRARGRKIVTTFQPRRARIPVARRITQGVLS